jgi:hypothetical protein
MLWHKFTQVTEENKDQYLTDSSIAPEVKKMLEKAAIVFDSPRIYVSLNSVVLVLPAQHFDGILQIRTKANRPQKLFTGRWNIDTNIFLSQGDTGNNWDGAEFDIEGNQLTVAINAKKNIKKQMKQFLSEIQFTQLKDQDRIPKHQFIYAILHSRLPKFPHFEEPIESRFAISFAWDHWKKICHTYEDRQ